ncbi:ABC transporter permease [Paenibacillus endoradicis]|uniref:ABC transporter permease n=1 Tax=Paenibacillus endoradicis TaxID=2972487 RepID=UPI002159721A|nr:ABC transporter permease [Paenibacillus endoradicis]MCR8657141.1 ABC transporter permease [Paenibacillus endoradicis]
MHNTASEKSLKLFGYSIGYIAVFLCFLFIIAPSILLVMAAFNEAEYFSFPPKSFSTKWFVKMLETVGYQKSIVQSIKLASISTIGALCFAIPAALAVKKKANASIESFVLSPLFFPSIIWALGLIQFYSVIGISRTLLSIVLAHMVMIMPFIFRIVLQSMRELNPTLEEASYSLGASKWNAFITVTLPLIIPGVIVGSVFGFLVSFTDVTLTMFISSAGVATFPVRVYSEQIEGLNPVIIAWSVVFTVIIFIMSFVGEKVARWSRFF